MFRKITIHDTSPVIFRRLLLYLYGAPVDKTVGAEQLCELMLLADRFSVDVLKVLYINMNISQHTVLYNMSVTFKTSTGYMRINAQITD